MSNPNENKNDYNFFDKIKINKVDEVVETIKVVTTWKQVSILAVKLITSTIQSIAMWSTIRAIFGGI